MHDAQGPSGDPVSDPPLSRRRTMLFRIALVLLVCLVIEAQSAIALAVLGLPLPASQKPAAEAGLTQHPFYGYEVVHPYLGYVNNDPRQEGGGPPGTFYGFGNPDGWELQRRSPETVVIAIVGGSVAAFFARQGVAALERELRAYPPYAQKKFIFVPLALGGYKQPQQLMTVSYFLTLGAHYDIVLNIDGFNEMVLPQEENIMRHVSPWFPRSWDKRVNALSAARLVGEVSYITQKREEWRQRYQATPLRLSRTVTLAWALVDDNFARKISRRNEKDIPSEASAHSGTYVMTGPASGFGTGATLLTHLADVWAQSSRQLRLLAEGNGIQYIHVLQPNQYVEGSKSMDEQERATAILLDEGYGRWAPGGYPYLQRAGATLAREGEHFHDLTMVFRDVREPLYIDNCCHVNARGNELLGAEIGRLMVRDLQSSQQWSQ